MLRSLAACFALWALALVVVTPAYAQDDRLLDEYDDLGEAAVDEDAPPDEDEDVDGASDEQKQWADAGGPTPDEHAITMNLTSASLSAGTLALVGTGVGTAAAITMGGLLTLMPSPPAILLWIGFIAFPAAGAVGGAVAGGLPFMDPAYLAVTGGAALAGAGLGSLIGWGIGAAAALTSPSAPFPSESEHTFKTVAGIMGGMAVGAGVGAAVAAPFMIAKPWETEEADQSAQPAEVPASSEQTNEEWAGE